MAHLAYFDESGDTGLVNSPTRFFVLACVLIPEAEWLTCLDALVALRSELKASLGIPTRPELKSTDLRRGRGPLLELKLSPDRRMRLFRGLMGRQSTMLPALRTFAIAIHKGDCAARRRDPRETAWQFALQRVDRFCRAADSRALLFPDEGHGPFIKRLTRRLRRFQNIPGAFGGRLSVPIRRVIEDPNDRQSHDSYFIQLADWNAYAAHRSAYIAPTAGVPKDLWDALGASRLLDVNAVRGGPPGIVTWPQQP
jgi:hypothetical protein